MYRLVTMAGCLVLGLLSATGCGSDAGSAEPRTSARSASPASTPEAVFFAESDSTAINEAAAPVQSSMVRAQAPAQLAKCNRTRSKGYPAWRACFHGLLDPLQQSLQALAAQLNTLAARDFPPDCVRSLGEAADTLAGFGGRVEVVLAGIDSDRRPAQARAMRTYSSTLARMGEGYVKPFQALTRVCYSPQDLESIDAQPTPTTGSATSP